MVTIDTDNAIIRIKRSVAESLGYTEHQLRNLKSDLWTVCLGVAHCTPGVAWRVEVV